MIRRYQYRAYPTKFQEHFFAKIFGCCRFVYNWALDIKIKDYEEQKGAGIEKPKNISIYDISKLLTGIKKQDTYCWLNEVPSICLIQTLNNLQNAYDQFFRRIKMGGAPGFPKFKSKAKGTCTFSYHQGYLLDQERSFITVPKCGKLKLKVHRRFEGVCKTVTIKRTLSGKYFASIVVDDLLPSTEKLPFNPSRAVGIDHGVINAITLSDGTTWQLNYDEGKIERKIARQNQRLSRKIKGSANFNKNKRRIAILHEKLVFRKKKAIESMVVSLIKHLQTHAYTTICIRKYEIKQMVKRIEPKMGEEGDYMPNGRTIQRKLNRLLLSASLGMISTQIKQKATDNGINILEFPASATVTSRICSNCSTRQIKTESKTRTIICLNCGLVEDIDLAAAKNTRTYALTSAMEIHPA